MAPTHAVKVVLCIRLCLGLGLNLVNAVDTSGDEVSALFQKALRVQQGLESDSVSASNTSSRSGAGADVEVEESGRSLLSRRFKPASAYDPNDLDDDDYNNELYNASAPGLGLTMNHLAKCGGSFLKAVFRHSVKREKLFINKEFQRLHRNESSDTFTVGLVRNPYNYLVSFWAYTSMYGTCCFKGWMNTDTRQDILSHDVQQGMVAGTTPADLARFRSFVKNISMPDLGEMSFRFYGKYLDYGDQIMDRIWQNKPTRWVFGESQYRHANYTNASREYAVEELRKFHVDDGHIDCWVQTEHLVANATACLKKYEALAGRDSVDWVEFDKAINPSDGQALNPSEHADCATFYDEETRAYVEKSEGHVLRAFGYSPQCSLTHSQVAHPGGEAAYGDPRLNTSTSSDPSGPVVPATAKGQPLVMQAAYDDPRH